MSEPEYVGMTVENDRPTLMISRHLRGGKLDMVSLTDKQALAIIHRLSGFLYNSDAGEPR